MTDQQAAPHIDLTPRVNTTWVQTTHGGPPTAIEETYDQALEKLRHAMLSDDPVIEFNVVSKRVTGVGRYRRLFVVANIVQIGDTIAVVSDD